MPAIKQASLWLRCQALSGWSFYFRWPATHVEPFRPTGIYLGPLYQACVAGAAGLMVLGLGQVAVVVFDLAPGLVRPLATHALFVASLALAGLTGLFHEDGCADTADSLGVPSYGRSTSRRQRIREAMRDPRLGTYGVTALIVLWLMRYTLLVSWVTGPEGEARASWSVTTAAPVLLLYAAAIYWSRWAGLAAASLLLPCPADPPATTESATETGTGDERTTSSHNIAELPGPTRALWLVVTGALGSAVLWGAWHAVALTTDQAARNGVESPGPLTLIVALLVGSCVAAGVQGFTSRRTGVLGGDIIGASICATELFFILYFLAFI